MLVRWHVECWGWNFAGQTAQPPSGDVVQPKRVSGLPTTYAVGAGFEHSCALVAGTNAFRVKCWGSNGFGQLTDGTTKQSTTPVP